LCIKISFIGFFICLYLAFSKYGNIKLGDGQPEYSLAYAFFHWGFSVQVVFVPIGVCMAYGFYVKKIPHLRVSAICEEMMGRFKYKKAVGRIIDALTILSVIGGVGVVSMGVVLVLIPMALLFTGAPFSAVKTLCIVLSIPFLAVVIGMLVGFFKWLKADTAEKK